MYMDALSCSVVVGDRAIRFSTATSLTNAVMTRAEVSLWISDNDMLTRIDFASLTYVGGYLEIAANPTLTLVSLPRLSQVQREIRFCLNAPSFVIPNVASGTAAPPGLTSVQYKGQAECYLQQGSGACYGGETCP